MKIIRLKDALEQGRFELAACLVVFGIIKVKSAKPAGPLSSHERLETSAAGEEVKKEAPGARLQ